MIHPSLGVVLKWVEPLDSARPSKKWRLYVFKNDEISETLHLHRQSAYLFGRDSRVADIELKHESCSKQHAVIQYRQEIFNSLLHAPNEPQNLFGLDIENVINGVENNLHDYRHSLDSSL